MAYPEYKGDNPCAYNVARAFTDTRRFMEQKVSKNHADWKWGMLHQQEYTNLPWSKTPLKFLFHKVVNTGGNNNTPNVSGYKDKKNVNKSVITSAHAANYKQIIQFDKDPSKNINLFSIDTGMNENPITGHYFDLNARHLAGDLIPMRLGRMQLEVKTETLILKPVSGSQGKSKIEQGAKQVGDEL